jgi:hypothetical protein
MIGLKTAVLTLALAGFLLASSAGAFAPSFGVSQRTRVSNEMSSVVEDGIDVRTGKPTGTSFLPKETVERAEKGNPTEKVKLAKDPTSAWVDVYEYARKIREGEMTWEEVEKADLDTVRSIYEEQYRLLSCPLWTVSLSHETLILSIRSASSMLACFIVTSAHLVNS